MGFNARRSQHTSITYLIRAAFDYGGASASAVELIQGPAGKFGRVRQAHFYNVTETFVGTTSGGQVLVGDGSDTNAYFDSGVTVAAGSVPAVAAALDIPDTVASLEIPADQALTVTLVECVGGTITGTCDTSITIDWYDTTGYAGKSVAA